MESFLILISGICWIIVYVELIYLGFKEKTCGMPFVALALSFAWEAVNSYIGLTNNFLDIQNWIILVLFLLNCLLIFTHLLYGKKYFPKHTSKRYFFPWTIIILGMSFILQYFFTVEFNSFAKVYSAFIGNLIMSILFINMLVNRKDLKGQNLIIAITKWLGTLAPTILCGVVLDNKLALVLGIFCSIFDLLYIYFLTSIKRMYSRLSKSSHQLKINK